MECPSCGKRVAEDDWICGFCDHILDASVLGDPYGESEVTTDERAPPSGEEETSLIAWTPGDLHEESEIPEAVILGNVDTSGELQVLSGTARRDDGRTSTFLFYASGATSRTIHPDAIPELAGENERYPRTQYEDLVLSMIDGVRTVRDIHRASGLAPQDVVVALLTLLDKRAVRVSGVDPKSGKIQGPSVVPSTPDPSGTTRRMSADQLGDLEEDEDLDVTSSARRPAVAEQLEITEGRIPMVNLEDVPIASPLWDDSTEGAGPSLLSGDAPVEDPLIGEPLIASEEVTMASRVPVPSERIAPDRSDTEPPQTLETPRPEDAEPQEHPSGQEPDSSAVPEDRPRTPMPLDPAFLVEVPPSAKASAPRLPKGGAHVTGPAGESLRGTSKPGRRESIKAKQRAALKAAAKRDPVKERNRDEEKEDLRPVGKRSGEKSVQPKVATPESAASPAQKKSRAKVKPPSNEDVSKAQKLFEQALRDKAEGNLQSARTNLKLAMTFDPSNELYATAFDEMNGGSDTHPKRVSPTGRSRARELYDAATDAENEGDVDRAIRLLEQAISHSKQPPFLNRLGVILAMRKREYARARRFVEEARALAPGNDTYERNLHKILSMAAAVEQPKRSNPA